MLGIFAARRTKTICTWAIAGTMVLLVCQVRAKASEPPEDGDDAAMVRPDLPNHPVTLSASDDGPFFSLDDLATYTPVPRTKKWTIRPPIWREYPTAVLQDIPFVPRSYPAQTVTYLAEHEVRYGDRQSGYVALTFDCESGSESTLQILDVLRANDVSATFFVLGRYAYFYPAIIHQIAADGHEIGNHSFFHPLFTDIAPLTATQEISHTEAVIDWAVGQHVPMRYFRFPYGGRNWPTRLHAAELGYQSAFWDIDPRGWDPANDPEDVVAHVQKTAHSGGIVIMHCGSWDDANALADVIAAIREEGLIPGTLTDALTDEDWDVPDYPKHWPRRGQGSP